MGFLDFLTSTKKPAAGVAPASPEKVKQALLAVNRPTAPFRIVDGKADGADLVAEWKVVDAQWYGIFEKFPKLRVVHVEADGGWVPYWLQRMEQHWNFSGNAEHEYLTKRPTEYFKSNICVAFRGDEPTMKAAVELVGDNNFTWDTDYPHPDGTFPWGVEAMLKQQIPPDAKRKLLWDNAARAFNLN